jgi:hypothetical protein
MARQGKKPNIPEPMIVEKRKELAEKIAALTRTADELPTAIPELVLFRRTTPLFAILPKRESLLTAPNSVTGAFRAAYRSVSSLPVAVTLGARTGMRGAL